MADFPTTIYAPRAKANRPNVVYNAEKSTVGYAEDIQKLDAEVVALETYLKIPTSLPDIIVPGSSYFETSTNTLYIFNGTDWKSTILS